MDLLANVPMWDDIERTLDNKFNHLNQSFDEGWESAYDGWNGFTRRVNNEATLAFGSIGGNRIESVKLAMAKSYPIIQLSLMRKWSSIDIAEILPVLLKLVKEVAMIMGGSVAVGTLVGAAAGSLAFGAGAIPGAIAGSGIGVQVGNLILLGMGLSAIAEYFYQGLPACLATLYEGIVTAWNAEEGVKPPGLDPTGASAWLIDERIDAAARKLAKGQEQLVMLLLTAIVTYITRGQVKAGIVGSLDGIAARSAKLQADMTNKQIAGWLARNEQRLLAHPELRMPDPSPRPKLEQQKLEKQHSGPQNTEEGPAPFSPIVPGGGLEAHRVAGGHLIERHVGKTEAQLRDRLIDEPKITGSSSFYNRATAEKVVSELLDAKQKEIANWLSGSGGRLRLDGTQQSPTGISLTRASNTAADVNSVRVILVRDPNIQTGFKILTGYPTPP
ncbi:DUF6861 domain-containing protein [Pseudomonas syringae group genomosp. 3]|uniref:Uncharacterized protein n=1 Tax=Pseudomonas syringae pv. primulae TaxID=251707 RepID=A0A3M4RVT3_9PSED|nr:RNase A-like domain-containing protein [Pseudomonas syringae group genomosp. 3]RMR06797.1 hypothetical protein ALP92_01059 [Pseudomonas syringae pv. primulae]